MKRKDGKQLIDFLNKLPYNKDEAFKLIKQGEAGQQK
jgi:hypothetical protein